MWIHIAVFIVIFVILAGWKLGFLPSEGIGGKEGKRLFAAAALAGNFLGLVLTATSGNGEVYSEGYRLEKETSGSHDEEFIVSVEGEEKTSVNVQIPEKETGADEEASENGNVDKEKTQEEKLEEEIVRYNEAKNDTEYYYLPAEWEGRKLVWERPEDRTGTLISGMFFIAALVILVMKGREEQTLIQKRYEELLMDYPGLIMKFTLLVQAGMTAGKAFRKIAQDYRKKQDRRQRVAYEEILLVCYEMDSGVSESEAYRRFGERCGQAKYKTFATLLIQNLQKGSRHLSDMLERESLEAWEDRKRKARVLGEAAATKLLLPMFMMLMVVMAIIMIPACLSFYGGV